MKFFLELNARRFQEVRGDGSVLWSAAKLEGEVIL